MEGPWFQVVVLIVFCRNYRLFEAFNPGSSRGGLLNVTQVGTWTLRDGFNLAQSKTKLENRRDFQGVTFKGVVTVLSKSVFTEELQ